MEQPPLDDLKNYSLPEAGAALRSSMKTILARWLQEVKTVLPKCDELTRKQLENSLPDLLERVAAALASPVRAATDQLIAIAPNHGSTRYHQEFSLNQLLVEYHILRRIVFEEVRATLGRPLSLKEMIEINQGIDIAVRQSAVAYADQQTAALKVEAAALTKFLSFLSHDLRGGLNGAVLMIEVLKQELSEDEKFVEAAEDLDLLRRSMLETVSTMERFLNAEKLRHGGVQVKIMQIDVAEMLGELQKSFAYLFRDQNLTLELIVQPPGLNISSDKQLLMMVMQNLISNAIKYGQRGKITVSAIGAEKTSSELGCKFSVADQGAGIPPEKLTDIFSAFSRGETYGQKGVGLGLFIARQAADLLKAKLWAESKIGVGSTFYLEVMG